MFRNRKGHLRECVGPFGFFKGRVSTPLPQIHLGIRNGICSTPAARGSMPHSSPAGRPIEIVPKVVEQGLGRGLSESSNRSRARPLWLFRAPSTVLYRSWKRTVDQKVVQNRTSTAVKGRVYEIRETLYRKTRLFARRGRSRRDQATAGVVMEPPSPMAPVHDAPVPKDTETILEKETEKRLETNILRRILRRIYRRGEYARSQPAVGGKRAPAAGSSSGSPLLEAALSSKSSSSPVSFQFLKKTHSLESLSLEVAKFFQ